MSKTSFLVLATLHFERAAGLRFPSPASFHAIMHSEEVQPLFFESFALRSGEAARIGLLGVSLDEQCWSSCADTTAQHLKPLAPSPEPSPPHQRHPELVRGGFSVKNSRTGIPWGEALHGGMEQQVETTISFGAEGLGFRDSGRPETYLSRYWIHVTYFQLSSPKP